MRQMYSCPSCGTTVAYSARFCGNCGINLIHTIPQEPPPQPLSYGYRYPAPQQTGGQSRPPYHEQPGCGQRPGWNQPQPRKVPLGGNPNQCQQQHMSGNRGAPQKERSSGVSTIKPLRSEIIQLMSEFFDQRPR
jgi:hypothetical protein